MPSSQDRDLRPRVTIGLAVRNGERYLREVLDSLLAQTFTDFELLIGDNASTDSTTDICADYERRDPRVRLLKSDTNRGPAWNLNRLALEARGEYFKWAAADDLCAPEYLQKCVEALDAHADAISAYPDTIEIDDSGKELRRYDYHLALDADSAASRFATLVLVNHRRHAAYEIFGLYRKSELLKTPLFEPYARGDSVLLARCALRGRFIRVQQPLFLNRDHSERSVRLIPTGIGRGSSWLLPLLGTGPLGPDEWWDSSKVGRLTFPEWNLCRQYWKSIFSAPIDRAQKVRCSTVMCWWMIRNLHKLARDLIYAVDYYVQLAVKGRPAAHRGNGGHSDGAPLRQRSLSR